MSDNNETIKLRFEELESAKQYLTPEEYEQKRAEIIASIGAPESATVVTELEEAAVITVPATQIEVVPTPVVEAIPVEPDSVEPDNADVDNDPSSSLSLPSPTTEEDEEANTSSSVSPIPIRLQSKPNVVICLKGSVNGRDGIKAGEKVVLCEESVRPKPIQTWVYNKDDKTISLGCRPDLVLTAPTNSFNPLSKKEMYGESLKSLQVQPREPNEDDGESPARSQKWLVYEKDHSIRLEAAPDCCVYHYPLSGRVGIQKYKKGVTAREDFVWVWTDHQQQSSSNDDDAEASNTDVTAQEQQHQIVWDQYYYYNWIDLPEWVREASSELGYTHAVWNDNMYTPSCEKSWKELTKSEQRAAENLGFHTPELWENYYVVPEDAGASSGAGGGVHKPAVLVSKINNDNNADDSEDFVDDDNSEEDEEEEEEEEDEDEEGSSYRFGDLAKKVIAKSKRVNGRSEGDGYKFGDITRNLKSKRGIGRQLRGRN